MLDKPRECVTYFSFLLLLQPSVPRVILLFHEKSAVFQAGKLSLAQIATIESSANRDGSLNLLIEKGIESEVGDIHWRYSSVMQRTRALFTIKDDISWH